MKKISTLIFLSTMFLISCPQLTFSAIKVESPSQTSIVPIYLRCYFGKEPGDTRPEREPMRDLYVWALDENGKDYQMKGYWYNDVTILDNLFYTQTSHDELKNRCERTRVAKKISEPFVMYSVAENDTSMDYMIWSFDQDKPINLGKFDKIVSFGDSISDFQNVANGSAKLMPTSQHYYYGRFSNGKNWLDYLSDIMQLPVYNWAIGGAGISDEFHLINGINSQVDSWATYMKKIPFMNAIYRPEYTLFTVLIGANDLVSYAKTAKEIADAEKKAIVKIIENGGLNILIVNLPDVSITPVFKFKTKDEAKTAHDEVVKLRAYLDQMAIDLQTQYEGKGVNIQVYDLFTLFNDFIENKEKYNLKNTSDSCLELDANSTSNYIENRNMRQACTSSYDYAFWDLLHPTTHLHNIFADNVFCLLKSKYADLIPPGNVSLVPDCV